MLKKGGDNSLKTTRDLTKSEIEALLDGPQKCFQRINQKVTVTEKNKVALRESLEKTVKMFKEKKDFKNVEYLNDLAENLDKINFFIEFADKDSIFYSFECITESTRYIFKDSGFFTLPK